MYFSKSLFLLILLTVTFQLFGQGLEITGVTTPADVNGLYYLQGVDADDYKYWKDGDGNYVYCDWYGGVEYWNIDSNNNDDDDVYYYYEYRDPPPYPPSEPPSTGWTLWTGATGTPTVTVLWPEIAVTGNNQNIIDGDDAPTTDDHTDFGDVDFPGGSLIRTFTIENSGVFELWLNGSPKVALSGTNADEFTVSTVPDTIISISGSTTFQVTFNPGALGLRTAEISISNDDSDENPFNFSIQGTGIDNSLPVELSSFTAKPTSDGVQINWTTESENKNLGFILERKTDNSNWRTIASYKIHPELVGQGTTSSRTEYTFTDMSASPDVLYYRLCDVHINGATGKWTETKIVRNTVPQQFTLYGAYPNPFNPQTKIDFDLPESCNVLIKIFNVQGQCVETLAEQPFDAGTHSVVWMAANQPSGLYFIHLQAGGFKAVRNVVLLK